jgi:hypothetical protein
VRLFEDVGACGIAITSDAKIVHGLLRKALSA